MIICDLKSKMKIFPISGPTLLPRTNTQNDAITVQTHSTFAWIKKKYNKKNQRKIRTSHKYSLVFSRSTIPLFWSIAFRIPSNNIGRRNDLAIHAARLQDAGVCP